MRTRVTVVAAASANPMGQQVFEDALHAALAQRSVDTAVRWLTVGSLRDRTPGVRRLPMRLASSPLRGVLGRLGYGGADVVHRLDLRLPPGGAGRPEVLTVHDCAPWRFDDEGEVPRHARTDVRQAAVVTAPSAFAAREVAEVLGRDDVHVVPNGVDPALLSVPPDETAARRRGLPERYLVHAGGASRRKNLNALAAAWPRVRADVPDVSLLLCGPPDPARSRAFEGVPGVVLPGRLPRAELLGLVAGASAAVVPSLYEGFGLPVLEAMALGTPVVAADRAALPEACGDAGLLVEPTAEGLAEGMVRVLTDAALAAELARRGRARAKDHDWARTAAAYLALYRSVAA